MMKRPSEVELSGGVSGDAVLAAIKSVMNPKMSRGYKATTLLAALPGGSIELDLTFNGSVAPCSCTKDGGAILQFTGEIIVEVRGGFGYILGNNNYQIRNPSNRPSHNNVFDGSKPGSGPITGIDGRKNNPTIPSGWKNKYSSSAIKECEDDWDIRVEIGAKFTAGAAIAGAQGILPFGGINRQGAYWSFKPSGSIQYGKSPVGVRAELYGQGVATVKISF